MHFSIIQREMSRMFLVFVYHPCDVVSVFENIQAGIITIERISQATAFNYLNLNTFNSLVSDLEKHRIKKQDVDVMENISFTSLCVCNCLEFSFHESEDFNLRTFFSGVVLKKQNSVKMLQNNVKVWICEENVFEWSQTETTDCSKVMWTFKNSNTRLAQFVTSQIVGSCFLCIIFGAFMPLNWRGQDNGYSRKQGKSRDWHDLLEGVQRRPLGLLCPL